MACDAGLRWGRRLEAGHWGQKKRLGGLSLRVARSARGSAIQGSLLVAVVALAASGGSDG